MTESISTDSNHKTSKINAIILTSFIAGTLDILAAFINTTITIKKFAAVQVLNFIASGVFGKAAFSGGWEITAAGLFFHYIIAYSFTLIYFIVYPNLLILKRNRIMNGILYGLFVWLIMNLIVVPLSQTPHLPFSWDRIIKGIIILMICVGLPISVMTSKFYNKRNN